MINIIYDSVVAFFKIPVKLCIGPKITLADGETSLYCNSFVSLSCTVAGIRYQDSFFVAPIGAQAIILGMLFLEQLNSVIDWAAKTLEPKPETLSTSQFSCTLTSRDSSIDDAQSAPPTSIQQNSCSSNFNHAQPTSSTSIQHDSCSSNFDHALPALPMSIQHNSCSSNTDYAPRTSFMLTPLDSLPCSRRRLSAILPTKNINSK